MSAAATASPSRPRDICGVVVLYFPGEGIAERLEAIAGQVDALVLVDNSAAAAVTADLRAVSNRLSAELISNARNLGVATALNQGVAAARARAADRVAFFDQDSTPAEDFRREMEHVWDQYDEAGPLGIVGSNYAAPGGTAARFATDDGSRRSYLTADSVITSGSLYDMEMLSRLGPFRDALFIDDVDIEYCWRALTNGYRVCRTKKPLLDHALGAPTRHAVFGRSVGTSNHAPFRRYFMVRNGVLLIREYFWRLPGPSLRLLATQIKGMMLLVAFETDRLTKLKFALLGLWHGFKGRTDRDPWTMIE